MAVISFDCPCGNKDPKKVKEYDGALGYEALVCKVCGRYYDEAGEHPKDEWSKQFLEKAGYPENTEVFL